MHREAAEAKLVRGSSWDDAPEPKRDRFVVRTTLVGQARMRVLRLLGGAHRPNPQRHPRPVR